MKTTIFFFMFVVMAYANEKYTDRYDNFNVQELLENQRLLQGYVKCALDQGPCTPEGKELKAHIKDALETHCAKCTDTQQKESKHVVGHLINHEPELWDQLVEKYDPTGEHSKAYVKELKEIKG